MMPQNTLFINLLANILKINEWYWHIVANDIIIVANSEEEHDHNFNKSLWLQC